MGYSHINLAALITLTGSSLNASDVGVIIPFIRSSAPLNGSTIIPVITSIAIELIVRSLLQRSSSIVTDGSELISNPLYPAHTFFSVRAIANSQSSTTKTGNWFPCWRASGNKSLNVSTVNPHTQKSTSWGVWHIKKRRTAPPTMYNVPPASFILSACGLNLVNILFNFSLLWNDTHLTNVYTHITIWNYVTLILKSL
ncbi:hypothetical protein MSBRW_1570 [Methanosarcina barkeri str. Wiesmoor]|uniref:Uncharacterized protein n=1 Tax=Methanosarcina barkeri str. Wiesmoor TaxID=1434109 RepID=A0A0E3QM96_METBA|nr:hypothetical protein MSBRW_1570 [Methanosarcina barkeri str. Wiesmoor]